MATLNKKKPIKESEYAGVTNAWLAPDGKLYSCGYQNHNNWAMEYIQDNLCKGDFIKAMDKIDEFCDYTLSSYPYQALHNLGWFRILDWGSSTGVGLFAEQRNPILTSEQKDTLMFWCSANDMDYDEFVNNLNGR